MTKFISVCSITSLLMLIGCEPSEDTRVEIVNNGIHQEITVSANDIPQTKDGKTVFGPSESIVINIDGDKDDPTTIVVRIFDLSSSKFIDVETRVYYRKDREYRDVWVIEDRYYYYHY